jgi:hypothetical protein
MAASVLAMALERRSWALASLCLLLGVADAAARLTPEALEQLLDLLEAPARGRRR